MNRVGEYWAVPVGNGWTVELLPIGSKPVTPGAFGPNHSRTSAILAALEWDNRKLTARWQSLAFLVGEKEADRIWGKS